MNLKSLWTAAKPHLLIVALFLVVFAAYFHPQLSGKVVEQRDIQQGKGMIKEINDFKEKTGEYTLWTNAMFGGMPTYQISSPQNSNLIRRFIEPTIQLFIKAPISWFLVAAISFYILMLVMGVERWLATIGAIAFSFTTNNMILFAEGHTSKFRALSYLPLAIAGIYVILNNKNYLKGAVLFLIAMSLNISANHYQMTYYFGISMAFFMLVQLGYAIKNGEIVDFLKGTGVLVVCGVLAVGPSFSKIYTTYEYSKDTMRGDSDLKREAAKVKQVDGEQTAGLDWDYAMMWSNSKLDLIASTTVPGLVGGSSGEEVGTDYEIVKYFGNGRKSVRVPLYWGGAESTSGPVYFGVIMTFLLILGLLVLPNNGWKWGLVAAILVIMFLSMGKYFEAFNKLFFNYFPKYSNFRAHNSALGVVAALFPILGILGLGHFLNQKKSNKDTLKSLYLAGGIVGGLCLVVALFGKSIFSLSHFQDENFLVQYFNNDVNQYDQFMETLQSSRAQYMVASAWKAFVLILLGAGALWAWATNRFKKEYTIAVIGLLVLFDLVSVDRKYLNEDNFVSKVRQEKPFSKRPVDAQIHQLEPKGRGYYRVFDLSINTFSSSNASYFHNTVGGYSAVKMSRIQDVIDSVFRSERGISYDVLDMFNAKYLIDREMKLYPNPGALGNAWFVDSFKHVNTATDELSAIRNNFRSDLFAIVHDGDFGDYAASLQNKPPSASRSIEMTEYAPNRLVYKCTTEREEFVVFSEIYYGPNKGWKSYVNDKEHEHIRVNYLLRGMKVPAGESEIIFEFKPQTFEVGERVSLASSIVIFLLMFGWAYAEFKKK